ncbi:hypothetical protein BWI17_14030 [Betaproteobacteria bacterium GR16-43]|nr:hypothetical protein BWI17_14030 [Betaproteobacteria bacterium GR16-43]
MNLSRAWGLLPFGFFVAYLAMAVNAGRGWDALWVCHVANLLLAAGIFARRVRWARAALLLILAGLPLWAADMAHTGHVEGVSVVSHLGGFAVAVFALLRSPRPPGPAWGLALATYLAAQLAARLFAPPALNVNVAHAPYPGWEGWFESHAAYWVFVTAATAAALWLGDRLLPRRFLPTHRESRP